MKLRFIFGALVCVSLITGCGILEKQPDLIPRDVLFGNPEKASPQLSPDGMNLAYLAPHEEVMNVWVRTVGKKDDRVVTSDKKRGIRNYFWAWDDRHILYIQDKGGDENWRLYAVDYQNPAAGARDLTPFENVQAGLVKSSKHLPDQMLVRLNKENPNAHDV